MAMNFNLDLMVPYKQDVERAMRRVLDSQQYILGPEVEAFEKEWSHWLYPFSPDLVSTIGVGSGTDAIRIALLAVGVQPGDVVLSPAFNVGYTALAVHSIGAINLFCDVDPLTMVMTPSTVADALEREPRKKVKAIIPVYMHGRLFSTRECHDAAVRYVDIETFNMIEDACQAHGAWCRGIPPGDLASMTCWSFYPTKNLGCLGDGGAITTSQGHLTHRARLLRRSGQDDRYTHRELGINSCLDELQAAILRVKLKHLTNRVAARRERAKLYRQGLGEVGDIDLPPHDLHGAKDAEHLFVIRTSYRDTLHEYLKKQGIPTLIHYPIIVPEQPCFRSWYGGRGKDLYPNALYASQTVLSLPMHADLTFGEQERVVTAIERFFAWNPQ